MGGNKRNISFPPERLRSTLKGHNKHSQCVTHIRTADVRNKQKPREPFSHCNQHHTLQHSVVNPLQWRPIRNRL